MTKKEIIIPEGAEIELKILTNTSNSIEIEILADGKPYARGSIPSHITGVFSFGSVKCAKGKKRGIVLKPSFNFNLINTSITGVSTE